jgi:parallel beta-helix repeat protein
MSEHKNKILLAIVIAAISVILLGMVSYTFFPAEPQAQRTPSNFGVGPVGAVGLPPVLPAITISNDGTVNSTAFNRTGDVYTQTCNIINQTILVQKDNIVIDGSGYAIEGSEIDLRQESNVTVRNMQFTNASSITLNNASDCFITENSVLRTPNAIIEWLYLENSNNNVISANNMTMANIELMFSSNNTLTGNSITDALSFGITLEWSTDNTVTKNYFENVLTPVEDEYNNNIVCMNNIVNCDQGVRVLGSGNTVFGNNMTFADLGYHQPMSNWMTGIAIDGANNTVYQNIITGYSLAGISIDGGCSTILANGTRIPGAGIGNTFFENIIACNNYGVLVGSEGYWAVDNNTIYHNDFIDNNQSASVCSPRSMEYNDGNAFYVNFWDNGVGGNYWSDYSQRYPAASELNNTGIMSVPYMIDEHNSDLFPLSQPYMKENVSDYSNPYAEQTPFPYAVYQTLPGSGEEVAANNRYSIYVEFNTLPPNATLYLNPTVPIANVTTTLRTYTFNLAEPLPASTTYTATIVYGEGSNTQSYTWNFTTPAYTEIK